MNRFETPIQIGSRTYTFSQLAFGCLLVLHVILILFTFREYGITSDETHHIRYGKQIISWYISGFADQALFQTKNTWLYGGFFDVTAYLFSQIVPLDRYDANHLFNAFFGLLGIIAAYRIGITLGGPLTGLLSALALLLTPRYYGHAFNNPKDIPFAVCYLWSLYYIIQYYKTFPQLSRKTILGTGLCIGFALGIRIGGLLLVAYLGLAITAQLYHRRHNLIATIQDTIPKLGITLLIAYLTMLVFWPYALQNPISGPIHALQKFSQFTESHTSFFDGRYVLNSEIPRDYAPTWFAITLPDFALIGLVFGLFFIVKTKKLINLMPLFAGLFPIVYATVMHTPLYDGIRHLLFAMPPLIVFSAIGLGYLAQHFKSYAIGTAITVLLLTGTAIEMIRLHPNQYVYFNTLIAGGVQNASVNYETDYWENTLKQGIHWAERNVSSVQDRKITINGFSENVQYMLDETHFESTPHPEEADIYLGTTRYDRHRKVPGEILHIIESANTPLLYVIRPDTSYRQDPFFAESPFYQFRLGEIYSGEKRYNEALTTFQKALEIATLQDPVEPFFLMRIYIRIGNQYEALNQYDQALNTYFKALEYDPKNGALHNNIGIAFARLNNYDEAVRWLQKAIQIDPQYFNALVNLGGVAAQNSQYEMASDAYRKALALQDDRSIRYSLAKIEYLQGNFDYAISNYQHILTQQPNDAQALYDLALAYSAQKNYTVAKEHMVKAIQLRPNDFNFYFTLGSINMYQNNYQEAAYTYQKAIHINAQNPDAYVSLGLATAHMGDLKQARQAFETALTIDPQHPEAKHHLQTLSR